VPPPRPLDRLLVTARTVLAPLTVDDADEMADVLADPALYTFTGGAPPERDALRRRYAALVGGRSADGTEEWFNWVVRLHGGRGPEGRGPAVGYVQATLTDGGSRAEVAWVVGTRWQGRGYASEAAGALVAALVAGGATTVAACVHPAHRASEGVARRCGLVPTGETDEDGEQRWELPGG
jgi:RimJ/RimL family protein N-acetyltransferase